VTKDAVNSNKNKIIQVLVPFVTKDAVVELLELLTNDVVLLSAYRPTLRFLLKAEVCIRWDTLGDSSWDQLHRFCSVYRRCNQDKQLSSKFLELWQDTLIQEKETEGLQLSQLNAILNLMYAQRGAGVGKKQQAKAPEFFRALEKAVVALPIETFGTIARELPGLLLQLSGVGHVGIVTEGFKTLPESTLAFLRKMEQGRS
jgi:hypothetical protein